MGSVASIEKDIGRNSADKASQEDPARTLCCHADDKRANKAENHKGNGKNHEPQNGRRNGDTYPDHDTDKNPVYAERLGCGGKIASRVTFNKIAKGFRL